METRLRQWACISIVALAGMGTAVPASARTYSATSYPYRIDATLTSTLWDEHEGVAAKGQEVSFSVRATRGGCIEVYFVPYHGTGIDFYYLTRHSQEECDEYFSSMYTTGESNITFTIVIDSTATGVDYHLEIDVQDSNPWMIPIAATFFCGFPILVAAIVVVVRDRRKRRAQKQPVPPPPPDEIRTPDASLSPPASRPPPPPPP